MTHHPPPLCSFILTLMCLAPVGQSLAGIDHFEGRSSLQLDGSLFVGAEAGDIQPSDRDVPSSPNEDEPFGAGHSWWWSVGAGVAGGDRTAHIDYNGFISFEYFIVKNFEIGMEFGGWFINQQGKDSAASNFNINFRYHFINTGRLSVFAGGGAGFILGTQPVPTTGTSFNFTPRFGMGLTWRLGDSRTRLLMGARWQHMSNARAFGAGRNPGRDNMMAYVGVMIPF